MLPKNLLKHNIDNLLVKGQGYRIPDMLDTLYSKGEINRHTYIVYSIWYEHQKRY